ncbi:hypothetical protein ACIA7R_31435 [Micromonospora chalcea]
MTYTDRIPAPRPVPSFADRLANDERDQLDARAATAEQERDEARDDRDAARRERNEWEQTAAQLGKQLDEMREARDVLRQQLTAEKARTKHLTDRLATAHTALRTLTQAYTDATTPLATGGVITTPVPIAASGCVIPQSTQPPVLGSSSARAHDTIRPADWQQNAVDAARNALNQTWGWSDDSAMPARIAEVAVSAIIDAGLAGPGGRCPTCEATYSRTMPAGEDQRCWTCSTEEVVGLPEYGGEAQREEIQWAYRWLDADGNVLDEMDTRGSVHETAEERARRLAATLPPSVPVGQVVRYRVVTTPEVVATFPEQREG